MSEFDERMDSNNVICPYCGYDYQPESEDFDEDEQVENVVPVENLFITTM